MTNTVSRKLQIETDHKLLVAILEKEDLSCLPVRLQCFQMATIIYCYKIFHILDIDRYILKLEVILLFAASIKDESPLDCAAFQKLDEMQVKKCFPYVREAERIVERLKDHVALVWLEHLERGQPFRNKKMSGEMSKLFGCRHMLSNYGNLVVVTC